MTVSFKNLPIIRQYGLNIASNSSMSQLGSAVEVPQPVIYDNKFNNINFNNMFFRDPQPPLQQQYHHQLPQHHQSYLHHVVPYQQQQYYREPQAITYPSKNDTLLPPGFCGETPMPRMSLLSGDYPRVAEPDRNTQSHQLARFQVTYSLAPMHFQEDLNGEFTDGMRVEEAGIQRRIAQEYPLPPVRPPQLAGSMSDSSLCGPASASAPVLVLVSMSVSAPVPASVSAPSASFTSVPTPISVSVLAPASSVVYTPQGDYDPKNVIHKDVIKAACVIVLRNTLNVCCLLITSMRQDIAHHALLDSCSVTAQGWAIQHLGTIHKSITVPVTDLLSSFGNIAHGVVQQAYGLHMSVWSREDKAAHKQAVIPNLTDETMLAFIYGEVLLLNDNNSETIQYPFEHVTITDVTLDAVWGAGYGKYIDGVEALSNILVTSGATVFCRLWEYSDTFKHIYNKLLLLIMATIKTTPHLLEWWNKYSPTLYNPGNFRFSTSILNDALTLSFHQGPFPPLINGTEPSIPSPSYSPLPWNESSVSPASTIVAQSTGYVSVVDSDSGATSQELGSGCLSTDPHLGDTLPNGSSPNGYTTDYQDELEDDPAVGEWPGEFSASFFQSLHSNQAPYTTVTQDATQNLTNTSMTMHNTISISMSNSAHIGTDPPVTKTLIPPIASLLDELLSNSICINPLIYHETLLTEDTLGNTDSSHSINTTDLYNKKTSHEDGEIDDALNNTHHANKENAQDSILNDNSPFDVFFLHPTLNDGEFTQSDLNLFMLKSVFPPMPQNSKASFYSDEVMPSLMPSRACMPPSVKSPPPKPILPSTNDMNVPEDIPMLNPPSKSFETTNGSIPYTGSLHTDGKTSIAFEGLTRAQAKQYHMSMFAQYNDYPSVYIPNVVHAIESYCFCQDQIIANDWNVHMF
ncbi:hypothetical protein EDB19DRAFT_1826191 [Suillus lakei]|nr:hypothetical protein EDB19DRAFT_1826191 [Suillus lakei]